MTEVTAKGGQGKEKTRFKYKGYFKKQPRKPWTQRHQDEFEVRPPGARAQGRTAVELLVAALCLTTQIAIKAERKVVPIERISVEKQRTSP